MYIFIDDVTHNNCRIMRVEAARQDDNLVRFVGPGREYYNVECTDNHEASALLMYFQDAMNEGERCIDIEELSLQTYLKENETPNNSTRNTKS